MSLEDWKELMKEKSLDAQLLWLIDSYERYSKENHAKWECLRNASRVTDNYKEAVEYSKQEADEQKERYEWLLAYISTNYISKDNACVCLRRPHTCI